MLPAYIVKMPSYCGSGIYSGHGYQNKIVYASTVTGLRLSTVDGAALVDALPAGAVAVLTGQEIIEIYDSANKVLKGYPVVGTGMTYADPVWSDDMADDGTADYTPFDSTLTFDTDHYVWTRTTLSWGWWRSLLAKDYSLYETIITAKLGTIAAASLTCYPGFTQEQHITADYANYTFYYTSPDVAGGDRIGIHTVSGIDGQTILLQGYTVKKVLSASASGANIFSTLGGATQSFSYKQSGFAVNEASYYVVIKRVR
jgi:hypothetical protein